MNTKNQHQYPCPICGYYVFDERPGSYDTCRVCGWEDDNVQLRYPDMGGANKESLIEAQTLFLSKPTSPAVQAYMRDSQWRPLNENDKELYKKRKDIVENAPWPRNYEVLYWWRDNFWLKDHRP
ncbi:MAG TPA: CPCC family cysteine-rich protein [Candidatus Saccharimonadales bacterium]|nr:CPCC family cysteine-rich protein [Candidatus Saccharimonadales bacterium]